MNKRKKTNWLATIGISLFLMMGVFFAWSLSVGETVISNSGGVVESFHTLACESEKVSYPFFTYDNASGRVLRVNAIFKNDKLSEVSLNYKLNYNDAKEIERSEANNHIAMNNAFKEDGLSVDSFRANYSRLSDGLQLSLYADVKDLNSVREKYFLLDGLNGNYGIDGVKKQINKKGLDCIEKK